MTKSTNFNYYEADNVYGSLFFQFPKVLMYGEQYKHLSSDAKLAYMVLKDRLEYSLRNNWALTQKQKRMNRIAYICPSSM